MPSSRGLACDVALGRIGRPNHPARQSLVGLNLSMRFIIFTQASGIRHTSISAEDQLLAAQRIRATAAARNSVSRPPDSQATAASARDDPRGCRAPEPPRELEEPEGYARSKEPPDAAAACLEASAEPPEAHARPR